jgi:hypothetical protein
LFVTQIFALLVEVDWNYIYLKQKLRL